MRWPMNI
jgi:TRAP-type C4-dicarboxylate transport system substrate-binding protein